MFSHSWNGKSFRRRITKVFMIEIFVFIIFQLFRFVDILVSIRCIYNDQLMADGYEKGSFQQKTVLILKFDCFIPCGTRTCRFENSSDLTTI